MPTIRLIGSENSSMALIFVARAALPHIRTATDADKNETIAVTFLKFVI